MVLPLTPIMLYFLGIFYLSQCLLSPYVAPDPFWLVFPPFFLSENCDTSYQCSPSVFSNAHIPTCLSYCFCRLSKSKHELFYLIMHFI